MAETSTPPASIHALIMRRVKITLESSSIQENFLSGVGEIDMTWGDFRAYFDSTEFELLNAMCKEYGFYCIVLNASTGIAFCDNDMPHDTKVVDFFYELSDRR